MKKFRIMLLIFITLLSIQGMTALAQEELQTPEKEVLDIEESTLVDENAQSLLEDTEDVGAASSEEYPIQMSGSKKGIQGSEWLNTAGGSSLGIKYTLLNVILNDLLNNGDQVYEHNGKIYQFNSKKMNAYVDTVRRLNTRGVTVSLVLLMKYDDKNKNMLYNAVSGHNYYALKASDPAVSEELSALFSYMAENLGEVDCHVDQWILGNEVNMPEAYNWTGTADPATNAKIYAQTMVLLYNAVEQRNQLVSEKNRATVSVSVDHSWNDNADGTGIGVKDFLDHFKVAIDTIQTGIDWGIAYHAYAAVMNPTLTDEYTAAEISLWGNNPFTPNNENAKYVTAANLSVLTEYVKSHFGSEHRIILSEQGFDAKGGQEYQAAGIAYTFYAAQYNDMIDAVTFRSLVDAPEEFGFLFGITNRLAYNVFKYMDTNVYGGETDVCLSKIGVKQWSELVDGFNMEGMAFRDVRLDSWYIAPVFYVYSNDIMTGFTNFYFGAADNLSRAEFATVLYRMENSPDTEYQEIFGDVEEGMFYTDAVIWAGQSGVVMGYENGKFGPADHITREQVAVMLYRYASGLNECDVTVSSDLSSFPDKDHVSTFALEAVQWAVGAGLITGNADGTIDPQGSASRAVCAALMQRFNLIK